MLRFLAIAAMTLLLPAAGSAQIYMNVQNCGSASIAVGPLNPSYPVFVPATSIAAGQTGRIRCDHAACWIQITYYASSGTVTGTYRHLYTTDRCTRGPQDAAVESQPLPEIGNCDC